MNEIIRPYYLIKIQQYPIEQHPTRYLEVVCEQEGEHKDINWVMKQYQRNRHYFEWEIVNEVSTTHETMCRPIKYKYDDKV